MTLIAPTGILVPANHNVYFFGVITGSHFCIAINCTAVYCHTYSQQHNLILFSRRVHIQYCHTDRMTERSGFTPDKETTIGWVFRRVWESLWAPTTCSISHILSHLRGHISSDPQPNYSTTRLTAIKCCTAGVQGSRKEPGCCHGHCHSADFQGWKEMGRAFWLVVALFWPTETGPVLTTITDTVVMQLDN